LDNVLYVVRDYGRYKDFYAPNVIESTLLRQTDAEDTFSLRMLSKAVVAKFALDTDFQGTYTRIDENKWYSISYSTRVREIENFNLADEHEAPANTGRGLIWRLYSISRFEQRARWSFSLQKTEGAVLATTRAARNNQNDEPPAKLASSNSNKVSGARVENGLMH
jgi:hypothetical protein